MRIERIPFTTREAWLAARAQDVTASTVAALVGAHPYVSAYEVWALKTGRIGEIAEETGAMRRGRLLEPVAVELLREQRPDWKVEPNRDYFRDPAIRLGATPDTLVTCPVFGLGTVQIKSVERSVFARGWREADTGEIELPVGYALQVITEAHLVGAKWAAVGALVVSHDIALEIIEVPIHAGVIETLRRAVGEFWATVEGGRVPEPDWMRDVALAARLHGDTGQTVDLSADNALPSLLDERAETKARIKADEARCSEIDAEIRTKVGFAAGASLPGWKISLKTQEAKAYQVAARTTRPIRVTRIQQRESAA
ncbi:hypothetical protein AOPFMNJM_4016 [Methylobacterium jeotgali]|uniref:YqaJ viral recombinase domain-containing protein n=4 Tax=Pseudomonadota TaxID=1224 RepID=A0ABQ4T322_9HYPH|nr:endonuclease [Methylobacterium sp.]GJE08673.1 hypothetical protein AOPFMNJM_4016 [Methylobacterium jeotgali]